VVSKGIGWYLRLEDRAERGLAKDRGRLRRRKRIARGAYR